MRRAERVGWCVAGSALVALLWLLLVRVILLQGAETPSILSGRGALICLLLLITPTATFVPLQRWVRIPLYDAEAVAAWAILTFALIFIRPSDPPTMAQFLLFAVSLTVALATVLTLLWYWAGLRIYSLDPHRVAVVRARRQGYLTAIYVVALLVLHGIGSLTPTSGVLMLVILVLGEMFFLARRNTQPAAHYTAGRTRPR